jgi:hypothetical protein
LLRTRQIPTIADSRRLFGPREVHPGEPPPLTEECIMRRIVALFVLPALLLVPAYAGDGARKPPPGFTSLFNGKDLSGWKDADKQAAFWKVEGDMIVYGGKGGSNLKTAKNYGDFELNVDWKITKGGDSGIYLRGQPQVQIWDNKEGSGGLWNNKAGTPGKVPLVVADNKPGEWNTFYIKMVGPNVTIKLNDKLVVDNAPMREGKVPPEGTIELQIHGNQLWFRNIFVKELNSK